MILDSNIIILAALPAHADLRRWLFTQDCAVSVVSFVEVLGFPAITTEEIGFFEQFFGLLPLVSVDQTIMREAAVLRQQRRMSVADAIIAATALRENRTLATRNIADFKWISGLTLVDPLA